MDGKIEVTELKAMLGPNLPDVYEQEWMAVLNDADLNKDGCIDLDDFFKMMYNAPIASKPF